MFTHKRRHALFAIPALLTLAVCSNGPVASAATPGARQAASPVTLNYWDMQWGTALQAETQTLVNQFNSTHPNIQVKYTTLSWNDYNQKFQTAIQAGNPPDVSGGDSGTPYAMAAQGQALPLNDLFARWQKDGTFADMVPWAYQKWELNGQDLGITWQFDSRAIFYRTDLFKQAGIAVPTAWAQLLAAAKKLNNPSKGIIGIAIPGKQGMYDTDQFYMTLLLQAGGGLADKLGNPTINTPQALTALNFEKQLSAYAAKGTPAWGFTDVEKAFDQGHAAIAFGGGWFVNDLRNGNATTASGTPAAKAALLLKNMGVMPVLMGPGGASAQHSVSFANGWMIFKHTKHPAEAKTFLAWMMQKSTLKALYESDPGNKWPVYKSLKTDAAYQANPMLVTLAQQTVKSGVDYVYPNNAAAVGISTIGTGLADYIINPVLSGAETPEQALAAAQDKLAPLFQKQH